MEQQAEKAKPIPYSEELKRKGVHLLSLLIPIIYAFIPKEAALGVLIPLALVWAVLDVGRFYSPKLRALAHQIFGAMMRAHETDLSKPRLTGATHVLVAAALTVAIFDKTIAITAFSILIVCDTAAALIGRKWGEHKFLDKSLEGTLAFVVSGFLTVSIIGLIAGFESRELGLFLLCGMFGVTAGALVEAAAKQLGIDDNLFIPLISGFAMWFAGLVFVYR